MGSAGGRKPAASSRRSLVTAAVASHRRGHQGSRFASIATLALATLASLPGTGGGPLVTRARWLGSLAQRRWSVGIGTGPCLAAAAGGVLIFIPHQAGH